MKNNKVKCNACGSEYTVRGITRHLKSCKQLKNNYQDGIYKNFILKIRGEYRTEFFMYVNVVGQTTLGELDQFLRDIWLECCNHLSAFSFKGEYYDINPVEGYNFYNNIDGTNIQLNQILSQGGTLKYQYDFGSTTELEIDVIDEQYSNRKDHLIDILARNKMPDFCLNNEEGLTPINSPRFGVCGYDGPLEEFEDITSWGNNEKQNKNKKLKEYKALLEKTNEFIKVKPFEIMPSDVIFVIEDPNTGINYYCNILGKDGLEYGLNAHIGNYGLSGFFEIITDSNSEDIFQNLNFISLMFEDVVGLMDSELEFLETYEPNKLYDMYPFFKKSYRGEAYKDFNKDDIKLMTLILERILIIYDLYKNKLGEILDQKSKGRMFKTFYKDEKWQYDYTNEFPEFESLKYNKLDAKRIKKNNKKSANKWELTSIFSMDLTEDDFFLEIIVLQDKNTGEILNQNTVEDEKDTCKIAKELIEETINKAKIIPMEITTDKKFYYDGLYDFINDLNSKIYHESLSEFMMNFKKGLHQISEDGLLERMLNNLPEEAIEEMIKAELNGEEINDGKMLDIISKLDLDLF